MLLFGKSCIVSAAEPSIVELQTNVGTITVRLNYEKAPVSAHNFISYIKTGYYKNTLIHRVIKDFVMQGGGYGKASGQLKTTSDPIANESANGLSNVAGTIAMARASGPDSATTQFFINFVDNLFLDYQNSTNPGYAVFGEVIDGMDVVSKIENLATYNELPFTATSGLVYIENTFSSFDFDASKARIRISRVGSGSVISEPSGINCGSQCYWSEAAAGSIKLTATAAGGYLFTGWRGDCQGVNRTISIDLSKGNHNCTAVFIKPSYAPQ